MDDRLAMTRAAGQADDERVGRMMNPASIAVVGASPNAGTGRAVMENLSLLGYSGPVYPVNKSGAAVNGAAAFDSLGALPEVPDLVVVAVNSAASVSIVSEAARMGVRSAVLLASGFDETGDEGAQLADQVISSRGDMSLSGPNCLGFVDLTTRVAVYSGQMPEPPVAGTVALVSNSGAVACSLTGAAAERLISFSHVITTGNQLDLGVPEFVSYLATQAAVRVIACYLEGFTHGRKLLDAFSRARAHNKVVAVLKGGRSTVGGEASRTHTGALAGSSAVQADLFSQQDVLVATDPDELLSLMELGERLTRPMTVPRVGVITISGGERLIMADATEESGMPLAQLSEKTLDDIRSVLPKFATASNPLDTTGPGVFAGQPEAHAAAVLAVARDPDVHLLLACQDAKNGWVQADESSDAFVDAVRCAVTAGAAVGKPVVVLSPNSGSVDVRGRELLRSSGAPCLIGLGPAMRALAKFTRASPTGHAHGPARPMIGDSAEGARLDASAVIERIEASGLVHWPTRFVQARSDAVGAAQELGFPVVLKLEAGLAHRKASGGVRIGLESAEQVESAWDALEDSARSSGASADRMSVQKMAFAESELFVGAVKDPQFGPIVLFGVGGSDVEAKQALVVGLAPLTTEQALELPRRLSLDGGLLRSSRSDLSDEVARVLVEVSEAICDPDLQAIDVNPLLILSDAVAIIDVKMVANKIDL